jgi:acyl-CoA synthetase (AMP-forming)/AMP-acid ligase II
MLRTDLIRPLAELLAQRAAALGDKAAFADDRRRVTYAQLEARSRRLAGHLAALAAEPGGRVLIYMDNRVEVVEAYLACPRAGLVGVGANPAGALPEIAYMAADSGARVILTDDAHLSRVDSVIAGLGGDKPAVVVVGDGPAPGAVERFEDLAAAEPPAAGPDGSGLDDVAWILYTSGTTGRPKGVRLTQRGCLWVVAACWAPIVGLGTDDAVLSPLPLFHSYALDFSVLGVLATGATAHIMTRFSTPEVLRRLNEEPFTVMPGVPTMFQYLLHAAGADRPPDHSLRLCVSAGAIMPAALNAGFEDRFGVTLLDGYGITETSTMVTMNWPVGGRVMGSCGLPVPGVSLRLVNPATGDDTDPGEEGELWVSGPNVMPGYHNRPEATAEVLRHGWYRTGDLARTDENGFVTISGRTKELIIRGGENIYPAEVEAVLLKIPGVADAAVIAEDHPDLGEVPVAFVVAQEGPLDPEDLIAACRSQLAPYKIPGRFVEIDAIPRTGSGKIMRYRLKEKLVPANTEDA